MSTDIKSDQPFAVAIIGGSFAGLQAALHLLRAWRRIVLLNDGQHRNRFAALRTGFWDTTEWRERSFLRWGMFLRLL